LENIPDEFCYRDHPKLEGVPYMQCLPLYIRTLVVERTASWSIFKSQVLPFDANSNSLITTGLGPSQDFESFPLGVLGELLVTDLQGGIFPA